MTDSAGKVEAPGLPARAFVGILLAASLAPLGSTMIAVALPAIGADLAIPSASLTQWLATSYLVVSIVLQFPAGRLGDRIGHHRNLTLGLAIYAAGALLGLAFAALPGLAVARIAMAAGSALMMPSAVAEIRLHVEEGRRGRAFGTFGSAMGIAAGIGPLLGGELTEHLGWRALFAAPLVQVSVAAVLVRTRAVQAPTARTAPSTEDFGLAVAARLLGRRAFAAAATVNALNNLAMYALMYQLPIYFQRVQPGETAKVGRSLVALTAAMVVCAPLGPRLAERIGTRVTTSAGILLALAALARFADLTSLREPTDAVLALAMLGSGIGLAMAPAQAAAMGVVAPAEAGAAAGLFSLCRYVGGMLGIALLGAVLGEDAEQADPSRHLESMPYYVAALATSLLVAQLLPGSRARRAPQARS